MDILNSMKSYIGGLGVSPSGKSFRVVRACVLARGLVAWWNSISRIPAVMFPFPLGGADLTLFPFGGDELSSFPSPHPPNLVFNFSWVYRYEEPLCQEYGNTF